MDRIHQDVSRKIRDNSRQYASAVIDRQWDQYPELARRYDSLGREKCLDDTVFHLNYLADALKVDEMDLFIEYLKWVKVLFSHLHIPAEDMVKNLEVMENVFRDELPGESFSLLQRFLSGGREEYPGLPETIPSFITGDDPHASVAQSYLDAVLDGSRVEARGIILQAVEEGVSVREVYLNVFQPVLREIGRLWQIREVSVAQEHHATAITQSILAVLYEQNFSWQSGEQSLVAVSVAEELHEMGIRMVADFFAMEGWRTYYLGANSPVRDVVQLLAEKEIPLLCISSTLTSHLNRMIALITAVRQESRCESVRILVGGYPFTLAPHLWEKIGADGTATDAVRAVETAERLLQE